MLKIVRARRLFLLVSIVLNILFFQGMGESCKLTSASSNNFPPMNMLDGNRELTGFAPEIAEAEAIDCEIWVESELDKGSRFKFTLPKENSKIDG